MSQKGTQNYPYMGPQGKSQSMAPQRYPQVMRSYKPQKGAESYPGTPKNPEANTQESQENPSTLKYDHGPPGSYPGQPQDQKDPQKQFPARFPKVTSEEIDSILSQNYTLLKTMNESENMEDPEFFKNISKLHQNLIFLARLSDQKN